MVGTCVLCKSMYFLSLLDPSLEDLKIISELERYMAGLEDVVNKPARIDMRHKTTACTGFGFGSLKNEVHQKCTAIRETYSCFFFEQPNPALD